MHNVMQHIFATLVCIGLYI